MRLEQLHIDEANLGRKIGMGLGAAALAAAAAQIVPNSQLWKDTFGSKEPVRYAKTELVPGPGATIPPEWAARFAGSPGSSPAKLAEPAAQTRTPTKQVPQIAMPAKTDTPPKVESLAPQLADFITPREGVKRRMYYDTENIATVGIGYNLERAHARKEIESVGANYDRVLTGRDALTSEQIKALFLKDLQLSIKDARSLVPTLDKQPYPVQRALVDMSFNMGRTRLAGFVEMLAAINAGDYETAADEIIDSKYYKKKSSHERAQLHADAVRSCANLPK